MLKPLDLQTIMPRTIDIQRIQQTHNSRPIVTQQETLRDAIKQSQVHQEQVQHNDASSKDKSIHDDEDTQNRERRYRRYGQRKKNDFKDEQSDQVIDSERGQHIDIKM
ncbi:MAG TPA: hypothetical protein DDW65_22270 [Firmicutes bacterium]|nr:hypothetical protein [Bacillota bacterium]